MLNHITQHLSAFLLLYTQNCQVDFNTSCTFHVFIQTHCIVHPDLSQLTFYSQVTIYDLWFISAI